MPENLTPYLGFMIFVVVSIITPGPNNIMTLHSGARYGISRTIPLILGIQLGFALMMAIIAYGSASILSQIENSENILRIICCCFLLYLAWRIATDTPPTFTESSTSGERPIRMLEAALFQWLNPKAWAVALAATGTYSYIFTGKIMSVVGFSGTFLLIGIPSSFMWAGCGSLIARLLGSPTHYRIFNVTAAILMVSAVLPALFSF